MRQPIQRIRCVRAAVLLGLVGACGMPPVHVPKDSERYEFESGRVAFDHKSYIDAQKHLKKFLDLHPGHAVADSAQLLLGLSQVRLRSYAEAAVEFSILTKEYPRSELRDDAAYNECLAYSAQMRPPQLDPTLAQRARTCFNEFLIAYPTSPLADAARGKLQEIADRLAEKEFRLGVMFANMKHYEAALVYLGEVLSQYPTSRWVCESLLWKGRCLERLGRGPEAAEAFGKLVEGCPDHSGAQEARRRLQALSTGLGGAPPSGDRAAREPR
jgi:outer membrane assembly lipoprotein YfiO